MLRPEVVEAATARVGGRRALQRAEVQLRKQLRVKWKADLVAVLDKIRTRAAARLFAAVEADSDDLADLLADAVGKLDDTTATVVAEQAAAAMSAGGSAIAAEFGGKFDIKHPSAVDWLKGRGAELVTNINTTTRTRVRNATVRAAQSGTSPARLARQLTTMVGGWSRSKPGTRSRAELVAITELGQAYTQGRRLQVEQLTDDLGLQFEKRWLYVDDDRVSQLICKPNGLQGWIPFDAEFGSGHTEPLGHPGCRCDLVVRTT